MRRVIYPYILMICLTACGGSSGGGSTPISGTSVPTGYVIGSFTNPIDATNQTNIGFNISGAEVGATYRYSFTDSQGAQLAGTGSITTSNQTLSGIDLTSLADGSIELRLTLTDAAGNQGVVVVATTNKAAQPLIQTIQLSGQITFDRVPYNSNGQGLDYGATQVLPVKETSLRIVDGAGEIIALSKTNTLGFYQVKVPVDTPVKVEVLAELYEADPILNWRTRVLDNGSGNSLYVLSGSLVDSGDQNQIRNLHAASGWDGTAYTGVRAAAPFAILDTVYKIYSRLRADSVSLSMPELEIHWSALNYEGSFYQPGAGYIEILGLADSDTDEYDEHVIVHEWRHYYEDQISRGDSIGGAHSTDSLLEPRTAYSEGAGNAWAGIILNDPIYKDAQNIDQQSGFQFNMESSSLVVAGWYSEKSVQEIIYDMIDTNNEGVDSLSLSVADLVRAWQSAGYLNDVSLTSIYTLRSALEQSSPGASAAVTALLQGENIQGTGSFGAGETNDAGLSYSLPVYHTLTVGFAPIEVCSNNQSGEVNRLENRQLIRFEVAVSGSHTLSIIRDAGTSNWNPSRTSNPDFVLYRRGDRVTNDPEGKSENINSEIWTGTLSADQYIMEVYDKLNIDKASATGGISCFDVQVSRNL